MGCRLSSIVGNETSDEKFREACATGDVGTAKRLLHSRWWDGPVSLHPTMACFTGNINLFKVLFEYANSLPSGDRRKLAFHDCQSMAFCRTLYYGHIPFAKFILSVYPSLRVDFASTASIVEMMSNRNNNLGALQYYFKARMTYIDSVRNSDTFALLRFDDDLHGIRQDETVFWKACAQYSPRSFAHFLWRWGQMWRKKGFRQFNPQFVVTGAFPQRGSLEEYVRRAPMRAFLVQQCALPLCVPRARESLNASRVANSVFVALRLRAVLRTVVLCATGLCNIAQFRRLFFGVTKAPPRRRTTGRASR